MRNDVSNKRAIQAVLEIFKQWDQIGGVT